MRRPLSLLLVLLGCGDIVDPGTIDDDGDGFFADEDCDDGDATVNEGDTYYADVDGDGAGDARASVVACVMPSGFVDRAGDPDPDCASDDTDVCGICGGDGERTFYHDGDGDGVGDSDVAVSACRMPSDWVTTAGDPEPRCASDDTDECDVCAGANDAMDCTGLCFGAAIMDGCGDCVGGTTGLPIDGDLDEDGTPDRCDEDCVGPRFIVQFDGVSHFSAEGGGPYSFQVVLHENGDIQFQYVVDEETFSATPSVGLQTNGGLRNVDLSFNSTFIPEHPLVNLVRTGDDGYLADYFGEVYWLDVTEAGEALDLGDDASAEVEIGFEFPFFGSTYHDAIVYSNGLIFLGHEGPSPSDTVHNRPFPVADLGAFIAPFWDDLNPTGGTISVFSAPATCDADCNDVPGGFAVIDSCGTCNPGPGTEPYVDCAGVCGGTATVDGCRVCSGGSTGVTPATRDCNGECGGTATVDACAICVGGTTGRTPSDPTSCPVGPDMIVDQDDLVDSITIDYVEVPAGSCLLPENCVRGVGLRKVLRFGTTIANIGNADMVVGVPSHENPLWEYDECHSHFHFEAYADYQLYDVAADMMLTDIGHKNGFCVLDIGVYEGRATSCTGYNCSNQGISAGCYDRYSPGLQCQWIDVTGLPDGDYDVTVETNGERLLTETNYGNNSASVRVRMTGDELMIVE